MPAPAPPVVLFGYHSSAFTQKVRMVLKLKQIPYTWIKVPSMMPRPTLTSLFGLTYRKIPVVAIGQDIYCDTSLIIETLEHHPSFQPPLHTSIFPIAADGRNNRALIRLFSSYYTDRPWFRVICGLMPTAVWRSSFGTDRAGLIGHPLDPNKLEAKIPRHLAMLELHLSILETQVRDVTSTDLPWLFSTKTPSLADVSVFFMLSWGRDVSRGQLVEDITMGESLDLDLEGMENVFNEEKFPGMWRWFQRVQEHFQQLPEVEERVVERGDEDGVEEVLQKLKSWKRDGDEAVPLIPTSGPWDAALDARSGLRIGSRVSVAPDDTGMLDPVVGEIEAASREEIVIKPADLDGMKPRLDGVRVHFPRIGFVVKPLDGSRISKL